VPGTDAFKVEGLVVAVLSERTFRVELANGHRLLGFMAGRLGATGSPPKTGDRVRLELSPYDLSTGRIVAEKVRI
jgi:translation initiation factor IF-1